MIRIAEFSALDDLAGLRPIWDHFFSQTPNASFCQSADWFEAYWNAFGNVLDIRVFLLRVGGNPVGIVPLVSRPVRTSVGTARVLTYPGIELGTCYGPVGPNVAATMYGVLRHLKTAYQNWDVLDLYPVDVRASFSDRTANAFRMNQMGVNCLAGPAGAALNPAAIDTQDFARAQAQLHVAESQIATLGTVTWGRYPPDLDEAIDPVLLTSCEELWENRTPALRTFWRSVTRKLARAGRLDLTYLMTGSKMLGYMLGERVAGKTIWLDTLVNDHLPAAMSVAAEQFMLTKTLLSAASAGETDWEFHSPSSSLAAWPVVRYENTRYLHHASWSIKGQLLRLCGYFRRSPVGLAAVPNPGALVPEAKIVARSAVSMPATPLTGHLARRSGSQSKSLVKLAELDD
jgi:hypothetical protein